MPIRRAALALSVLLKYNPSFVIFLQGYVKHISMWSKRGRHSSSDIKLFEAIYQIYFGRHFVFINCGISSTENLGGLRRDLSSVGYHSPL